jgi:hypothetical protein
MLTRTKTDIALVINLQSGTGQPPVVISQATSLKDPKDNLIAQAPSSEPAVADDFTPERLESINAVLAQIGLELTRKA